jgi:predicted ATPase
MRLHAALAWSLMYTAGPVRETAAAWTQAIEMSERLNDAEYQLRALWGLWIYHLSSGESRATLALARRFGSLAAAKASPAEGLVGERMVGVSLHYMGDQIGAREHLERVLDNYVTPAQRSHAIRFQYDQRVSAQATLVRVLWLQGLPDQAARVARAAIDDGNRIDHALSLALALEAACLLDLFAGDLDAAERSLGRLLDHAKRHAIGRWHAWGHCFEGVLRARRGDFDGGLQLLRTGLDDLRRTRFALFYIKFLADLAEALGESRQPIQGIEAIDEALARSERNDERWCFAELLRIKGELVLKAGAADSENQAERLFTESLDWARRQGALSWELRTATSLAQLRHSAKQDGSARELLLPVYEKFSEGFETADLKATKSLLDSLR